MPITPDIALSQKQEQECKRLQYRQENEARNAQRHLEDVQKLCDILDRSISSNLDTSTMMSRFKINLNSVENSILEEMLNKYSEWDTEIISKIYNDTYDRDHPFYETELLFKGK